MPKRTGVGSGASAAATGSTEVVSVEIGLMGGGGSAATTATTSVGKMVSEKALIVFGRKGCCMCHVLKLLLQALGANPAMYEVEEGEEPALGKELSSVVGCGGDRFSPPQFPAVFIGGRLFGGLERVMATHISGELVPILIGAGALWL